MCIDWRSDTIRTLIVSIIIIITIVAIVILILLLLKKEKSEPVSTMHKIQCWELTSSNYFAVQFATIVIADLRTKWLPFLFGIQQV